MSSIARSSGSREVAGKFAVIGSLGVTLALGLTAPSVASAETPAAGTAKKAADAAKAAPATTAAPAAKEAEAKKEEATKAADAAADAAAKTEKKAEAVKTESGDRPIGLLGLPVAFGPKFQLGLPNPIGGGGEVRAFRWVGVAFDYAMMPRLTLDRVSGQWSGWDVNVQFFPGGGSFFLGCGFGRQDISASITQTVTAGPLSAPVTVSRGINSTLVIPHIGWRWTTKVGLFFGLDIGAQIPVGYTAGAVDITTTEDSLVADAAVALMRQDIEEFTDDYASLLGNTPLPMLTLLQIGFMF